MKKLLFILITLTLTACPRGEYENLESLLSIAKGRYQQTQNISTPKRQEVAALATELDRLSAKNAANVAKQLEELLPSAGYTTRPALSELIQQYRLLAKNTSVAPATLELISSRTYNLIASELEGVAFTIES